MSALGFTAEQVKQVAELSSKITHEVNAGRIATLESDNAALRAEVEGMREDAGHLWHALKDLSFDCDGVTQTDAPSLGTYNATFAVIQRLASKYQALPHYQSRKEADRG